MDAIRPRGISGVFRSHAPLSLHLWLAAREDRMLWWSADMFVVLEPPAGEPATGGPRWLRWLDQRWDPLSFVVPMLVLLSVAAAVGSPPGSTGWRQVTALVCALLAMFYGAAIMTAVLVRGLVSLYRTLVRGRPKAVTDAGVGQVRSRHWSMPLCHLPAADADAVAGGVLDAVQRCVSRAGRRADILCLERGMTSQQVRDAVRGDRRVSVFTSDPPVLALREDPAAPLVIPPAPARTAEQPMRFVVWLVAGMGAIIALTAATVTDSERQACAALPPDRRAADCTERPTSYGDAVYWLLNRLSGGDPEGLGAYTFQARTLGLLITLMGYVLVGGVITWLVQEAVERTQRYGQDVTDAYNGTLPQPTRSVDDRRRQALRAIRRGGSRPSRIRPRRPGDPRR